MPYRPPEGGRPRSPSRPPARPGGARGPPRTAARGRRVSAIVPPPAGTRPGSGRPAAPVDQGGHRGATPPVGEPPAWRPAPRPSPSAQTQILTYARWATNVERLKGD